MPSPYQYPWVNYFSTPTTNIDSTPTIVCGAITTSIVDSISVCNTSQQDIFVSIYLIQERIGSDNSLELYYPQKINKFLLPTNASNDLISYIRDSTLILEGGDLVYAYSDFSGNTFDCIVSGRQLLETAVTEDQKKHLKKVMDKAKAKPMSSSQSTHSVYKGYV